MKKPLLVSALTLSVLLTGVSGATQASAVGQTVDVKAMDSDTTVKQYKLTGSANTNRVVTNYGKLNYSYGGFKSSYYTEKTRFNKNYSYAYNQVRIVDKTKLTSIWSHSNDFSATTTGTKTYKVPSKDVGARMSYNYNSQTVMPTNFVKGFAVTVKGNKATKLSSRVVKGDFQFKNGVLYHENRKVNASVFVSDLSKEQEGVLIESNNRGYATAYTHNIRLEDTVTENVLNKKDVKEYVFRNGTLSKVYTPRVKTISMGFKVTQVSYADLKTTK